MANIAAIVVHITFPNKETATKMSHQLVENKLVACAQLLPITSIYEWKDDIQEDQEILLQAKTKKGNLKAIEEIIAQHHPYEVPEIIAIPAIWGHGPYLDWVQEQTEL